MAAARRDRPASVSKSKAAPADKKTQNPHFSRDARKVGPRLMFVTYVSILGWKSHRHILDILGIMHHGVFPGMVPSYRVFSET